MQNVSNLISGGPHCVAGRETVIEALRGMSHLGCHKIHLISKQKERNIQKRLMWCFPHEGCAVRHKLPQTGAS